MTSFYLDNREFKLRVKRQTPGKEKFYGIRQYELAVLKLKYIILPRKFEPAVCRSGKREA
jgi:hypothetical protein